MNIAEPFTLDWIWSIMWALLRVSGFFISAPFFGHRTVPVSIKIPIALTLAFAVGPLINGIGPVRPESLWQIGGWAVGELVIGGIIGFGFAALFWGIRMAGDMVGMQMGFAIVNVIDPNSSNQVSLIGEFQYILALLILLVIDGHHLMITGLVDSYRLIPIGAAHFGDDAFNQILRLTASVFVTAVKIGSPIMITLLLTDVSLGIVARTVPQMNIFIVGFPLKIGTGLLILGLSLPLLAQLFSRALTQIDTSTRTIVAALVNA